MELSALSPKPPSAAGVMGLTPHSLRHSLITAPLDAGVALRDVQIAARHADPRTTTRYDRLPRRRQLTAVPVGFDADTEGTPAERLGPVAAL